MTLAENDMVMGHPQGLSCGRGERQVRSDTRRGHDLDG